MYPDKSLLPREALRLAALGFLSAAPQTHAALAAEIRHFSSRIAGPSLDLMAPSIELLRHEGLVRPLDGASAGPGAPLTLTDEGRAELFALLRSAVRAPLSDVNRLVLALKFHFLHLLDASDRRIQLAMMVEACEVELARLLDLRGRHAASPGHLADWLDNDIAATESRRDWLQRFHDGIASD